MIDIVTVGWLTMDDIVLTDHSCRPGVLGGGALYSAIGARIWSDSVGVHSVTGRSIRDDTRARLAARGLDAEGVGAIDGAGLQLWLLHESETFKQQVPKLNSSTAEEMDRGRGPMPQAYEQARGFHVAPQTPAGTAANVRALSRLSQRPVVTVDILSDALIDRRLYADLGFLRGASAFLPSEAEIARIWGPPDIGDMAARDRVAAQMPHGGEAWRAWIPGLRRQERRPDPYAGASGQACRYDRRGRWLLRRVRRRPRGWPAARGMRRDGGGVSFVCCRSLRRARNGTADRGRPSGAARARACGDPI